MILIFINSMGLIAFLKLAFAIYSVQGQIGESIKGKNENFLIWTSTQVRFLLLDSIAEFDLLSVALSDIENINNGGKYSVNTWLSISKKKFFALGVTYVEGTDGFPAFSIANFANLRSPSRLVVPDKLGKHSNISKEITT